MRTDLRFRLLFDGRVEQLFLYITDRCGLRCEQCLYKTTLANREMLYEDARRFVVLFGTWGARKLTFIGGEPLLYDYRNGNSELLQLAVDARQSGYKYVRVDTNGQQGMHNIVNDPRGSAISNVAVSLDGFDASTNDMVRGRGSFARAIASIRLAVEAGLYVTVTCCVHPAILGSLAEILDLADELGVREVNFHPLFKMGIARDEFSGDTAIAPRDWLKEYQMLSAWRAEGRFGALIRAPQRFVEQEEYERNPRLYQYCPSLMGERALIHPDGDIRICALCIGTDLKVGSYEPGGDYVHYVANRSELSSDRVVREPCMSQVGDFDGLVPLCISYKPFQNEYVWQSTGADSVLGLV